MLAGARTPTPKFLTVRGTTNQTYRQNVAYHFLRVILKWDIFETHSMVSTYNDLVYLMHLLYTLSSLCETVYARKQVNHSYQIRN